MKSVELSALKTPHYFVNISSDGSITIYDQLHNHLKNFRYQKSAPLKLSILRPKIFTQTGSKNYPKNILLRTNHWKAHLEQDYLTILPKISLNSSYLDKQFLGTVLNRLKVVSKKIATPFKALFHFILESACKKFLI